MSENTNEQNHDQLKSSAIVGIMGKNATQKDDEHGMGSVELNVKTIDPVGGWIDIKESFLPYGENGEQLYPSSYRFQVKPSDARLMKHFSTLDIENPISVQEGLLFVVENYVRVFDGNRLIKNSLDVIFDTDKLFFTLLVHNFSGSVQKLAIDVKSPHSGENQQEEITPYNLVYTDISENPLMKYFDKNTGVFTIKTATFGNIGFKPHSIEKGKQLADFVITKQRDGQEVEQLFIELFGMFDTEDTIEKSYNNYFVKTQNQQLTSFLLSIKKYLQFQTTMEIRVKCAKKGLPFQSPITDLSGFENIFTIHVSLSELQ